MKFNQKSISVSINFAVLILVSLIFAVILYTQYLEKEAIKCEQNVQAQNLTLLRNEIRVIGAGLSLEQKKQAKITYMKSVIMEVNRNLTPLEASDYSQWIVDFGEKYNQDPWLVCAIAGKESGFDAKVVSKKGAMGICQIMPFNGSWLAPLRNLQWKKEMLLDPKINIEFACLLLMTLSSEYDNVNDILACYNGGTDAVWNLHHNVPDLNSQTKNYILEVPQTYKMYSIKYKVE